MVHFIPHFCLSLKEAIRTKPNNWSFFFVHSLSFYFFSWKSCVLVFNGLHYNSSTDREVFEKINCDWNRVGLHFLSKWIMPAWPLFCIYINHINEDFFQSCILNCFNVNANFFYAHDWPYHILILNISCLSMWWTDPFLAWVLWFKQELTDGTAASTF